MEEKANILLIDDRPLNPDSCKNMLHLDGIQTFQAFSPEESIQIAERLNLSLCIIDVQMPEIDGIEIAKALHQHITIAEIPILFLISSFSEKFQLYSNEVIHGIDFVLKTIEPEIFQNKVKMLLDYSKTKTRLAEIADDNRSLQEALRQEKLNAEQASYTKSLFLSNMSHEIRTPLNGVLGMANILAETPLTEDQQTYLNLIQVSGENLLLIINDILDFSKIEAGIVSVEKARMHLHKEIETTVSLMKLNAQSKHLSLSYSIDPNIHPYILGDALRLRQMLSNLLNNAIKFTEIGSVELQVKIAEKADFIKFTIIDTGIGIDVESTERLFKEFNQADNSITRKFGGTGLGLAICRSLVKVMGGQIGLTSELGKGSSFWFEIPYVKSAERKQVTEPTIDPSILSKLKILVAEDNAINQKVAIHSLQQLGYQCDLAKNGRIAIEMHNQHHYDIIFMDIQMPEVDGLEATISIRSEEKAKNTEKPVVIIAATANAFNEDKQKCFRAGMNYHLSKPFRPEALKKILIKAILNRH